jgi:hypothetical protein
MAITLADVARLLDEQGLHYSRDEHTGALRAGFETETYRDQHGATQASSSFLRERLCPPGLFDM